MEQYPHMFAMDRIWLMDRNYHGAPRIARLIARTHVLIRLKSDLRHEAQFCIPRSAGRDWRRCLWI